MIIVTGDTHRNFQRIWDFAEEVGTTQEDTLIILGDVGIKAIPHKVALCNLLPNMVYY